MLQTLYTPQGDALEGPPWQVYPRPQLRREGWLNLNGDYMSDALAAQVGGLGMAPGSNVGDGYAIFEATHGTAPKYTGLDKINPGSLILSGALMFDFMGWNEAAELVRKGIAAAVAGKTVTYDLARQMEGATEVACSAFGKAICDNM